MMIRVKCPNPECGREFILKPELVGRPLRCGACRKKFMVPAADAAPVLVPEGAQGAAVPQDGGSTPVPTQSTEVAETPPEKPSAPKPAEPDPLVGQKLGHYLVLERIGKGGMATVYKARDVRLDKIFALKVMSDAVLAQGREFAERFVQEARTAAKVEHLNVLPVHYIGVENNRLFIAMQYVDGGTLADRLANGARLPQEEATRIMRDVALALSAAHAQNIVHRDIKPSNIMLTRDGRVLVSDFGVAKMGEGPGDLTLSGLVMGTPAYMSPEQCRGQSVDARTDLYSLGVMYYRAVTGQLPFLGRTPKETIHLHLTQPPPDPRLVVPDLHEWVAGIIIKLLAKSPDERYASAMDLVADLNTALAALTSAPAGVQTGGAAEASKSRRSRALYASLALLFLAAGLSVLFVLHRAGVLQPQPEGSKPAETARLPVQPPAPQPLTPAPTPPAPAPSSPPLAPPTGSPAPAAKPPEPVASKTSEKTEGPVSKPVASAPEAKPARETPTAAPEPAPQREAKPSLDLAAYVADIKPVNERIAAGDFAAAKARANLLREKYPQLIEIKLSNLDRIVALRKRCLDRVNSGDVTVTMGDMSKRYAFAGPIKKADETGLTAAIKKDWGSFTKEEIAAFYRKASDPKNAEDLVGIAAFLVEGNAGEKEYEQALDLLGEAVGLKADVASLVRYVERLRQASKEAQDVQMAETATKAQTSEKADAKTETREEKSGESAAASSKVKYDDVYVATAATGEKIPHPLSKKCYTIFIAGKKILVPEGMVYVPAGPFIMGDDEDALASPAHRVEVEGFCIDKYEVTNAQYMEFVKATQHPMPEYIKANGGEIPKGRENHPVCGISWEDAQAYCEWCGKRLPTEAEWEKAASWDARTRRKLKYPWGNEDYNEAKTPLLNWAGLWGWKRGQGVGEWKRTFFASDKGQELMCLGGATTPVGAFKKGISPAGCYDMLGNVEELVADWLEKYPGNTRITERAENLFGQRFRVARGGDWTSVRVDCAERSHVLPRMRGPYTGFRCAKTP